MTSIDVAQVAISLVVLLLSLSVHELAHAWTADRLGDPTARQLGRVSLNPLVHADLVGTILFPLLAAVSGLPVIGWAKPVRVNVSRLRRGRRDYVLVAAAGPVSNLALAAIAAVALRMVSLSVFGLMAARVIQLNVLLAIFNLLPIPPLDGGNVVGGLLPVSLAAGFDTVRPYGFLMIYALMFTGLLGDIVAPPYSFLMSWLL